MTFADDGVCSCPAAIDSIRSSLITTVVLCWAGLPVPSMTVTFVSTICCCANAPAHIATASTVRTSTVSLEMRDRNISLSLTAFQTLPPRPQKWTYGHRTNAIKLEPVLHMLQLRHRRASPHTRALNSVCNLLQIGSSQREICGCNPAINLRR